MAGNLPTDKTFTGQRSDVGIGLLDFKARAYSPTLGRFVSADTVVPEVGNPQALNRYSYVANNPIKHIDPSGHCWGIFSGVRGLPTYGTTCNNLDMALTIVQHPETSAWDKTVAGAYIVGEGLAHATAVVYGGVAVCGAVSAACYQAATAGGIAATATCSDGDCTNEVQVGNRLASGAADALKAGGEQISAQAQALLDKLPKPGSSVPVPRGGINSQVMAELHAFTRNEFALLRTAGERTLTRGGATVGLPEGTTRIIAHTHPWARLSPSNLDVAALVARNQRWSLIITEYERIIKFFQDGSSYIVE